MSEVEVEVFLNIESVDNDIYFKNSKDIDLLLAKHSWHEVSDIFPLKECPQIGSSISVARHCSIFLESSLCGAFLTTLSETEASFLDDCSPIVFNIKDARVEYCEGSICTISIGVELQ
jgi:hypothetical protein